jgi:riboflavin biosynthesis pyrimidine reductase
VAIERARRLFGPTILVEAGQSIIAELISLNIIDRLELSVTPITGGEDQIDIKGLLAHFPCVSSETVGETVFYTATRL